MLSPGTAVASDEMSVTPACVSWSELTTEMLYGTASSVCTRRVAVTCTSASESAGSIAACCEYAACDMPYNAMHTAVRTGVWALSARFTDFATCRAVLDCLMLHPPTHGQRRSPGHLLIPRNRRARQGLRNAPWPSRHLRKLITHPTRGLNCSRKRSLQEPTRARLRRAGSICDKLPGPVNGKLRPFTRLLRRFPLFSVVARLPRIGKRDITPVAPAGHFPRHDTSSYSLSAHVT